MADHNDIKPGIDKNLFIEMIRSLEKKTIDSGAVPKKEEIDSYFQEMDLSNDQRRLVYQYLMESQKKIERKVLDEDKSIESLHTAYYQMYLKDLQNIVPCTPEEEDALYERLSAGDKKVIHVLSDQWLPRTLEMIRTYALSSKDMEDAVQEANMGVFLALNDMLGCGKALAFRDILLKEAQKAVEAYVRNSTAMKDMDDSLLAKAALVYEAQKYLAEEWQRIPTIEELSQYTKLPESELEDIFAIVKNL